MIALAIWVQPSAIMATENHPDVSQRVCRFGTCSVSLSRASLHSGMSLCGGFVWRISSGADSCELPADFRGGFSWRISAADFRGGLCGGFLRRAGYIMRRIFAADFLRILSGPKPCKLHASAMNKIHRKSTTQIHRMLA